MRTEHYKLGWLNATIRRITENCYQLTIEHPVKCVQRFKTRQDCLDVLMKLEQQRRELLQK